MPPKVMTGARGKLGIYDPSTNEVSVMGIFSSVSYGLQYDVQPAYILGRYSPAALEYTSQEPVNVTCSGWRVIGHGPHRDGKVPRLQELLTHEYLELAVIDRQLETGSADARIGKIRGLRPTGYTTGLTARQLEEMTTTYVGLLIDDESTTNVEGPGSTELP